LADCSPLILAVLTARFSWLAPQLYWATIGWPVLYMTGWMFVIQRRQACRQQARRLPLRAGASEVVITDDLIADARVDRLGKGTKA